MQWICVRIAAVLALTCPVAGFVPLLGKDMDGYVVDWGVVPAEAEVRRVLRIPNIGNATVHVRWETPSLPFFVDPPEQSFPALKEVALTVGCYPLGRGLWASTALLRTNVGVTQEEATNVSGAGSGRTYRLELRCSSKGAPQLEIEPFSGVYIHSQDGIAAPTYLEPSVPSEWERLIDDVADASVNVSSTLVLPSENLRLGCSSLEDENIAGHVVLLERGSCYFQSKALAVQRAGGVGVLLYDHDESTSFRQMAMAYPFSPPTIPAFLVSRKNGLGLKARLLAGMTLRVSLICHPIMLWTLHPQGSGSDDAVGVVRLRNSGVIPASWSISSSIFDYNQADLYTVIHSGKTNPDEFELPNPDESVVLGTEDEIPQFSGRDFDDGVAVLSLPFRFPFFGTMKEEVQVSANGLLAFGKGFIPGLELPKHIPSLSPPNGFIAPYWSQLQCRRAAGCQFLAGKAGFKHVKNGCNCTEAYVVQLKNVEQQSTHGNQADKVSVETRLCSDGCIEMRFPSFPSQADDANVSIGLESMTGANGFDISSQLKLRRGQPVAAAFLPWLVPQAHTSGTLAPGDSRDFRFRVAGPVSKQGWLHVSARDVSGIWRRQRQVRVVQRVFRYTWRMSEWGPCQADLSSEGNRVQMRSVWCMGSDGKTYAQSKCSHLAFCEDSPPGWVDRVGMDCSSYEDYSYCAKSGGHGHGWRPSWGSFSEYQADGLSADSVCCACGGGSEMRHPYSLRTCKEDPTTSTTSLVIPHITTSATSAISSTVQAKETRGTSTVTYTTISTVAFIVPTKRKSITLTTTDTTTTAMSTTTSAGGVTSRIDAKPHRQVSLVASSSLVISGLHRLTSNFNRSVQNVLVQTFKLQQHEVEILELRQVPAYAFTVDSSGVHSAETSQSADTDTGMAGLAVHIVFAVLLGLSEDSREFEGPEDGNAVQLMEAVKSNPKKLEDNLATVLQSPDDLVSRQLSARLTLPKVHHVHLLVGPWGPCVSENVSCELPIVSRQRRDIQCIGARGNTYKSLSLCHWLLPFNTTQLCPQARQTNQHCLQNHSRVSVPPTDPNSSDSIDYPVPTLEDANLLPRRSVSNRSNPRDNSIVVVLAFAIVLTIITIVIFARLAMTAKRKFTRAEISAAAAAHESSEDSHASMCQQSISEAFATDMPDNRLPAHPTSRSLTTLPATTPPSLLARSQLPQLPQLPQFPAMSSARPPPNLLARPQLPATLPATPPLHLLARAPSLAQDRPELPSMTNLPRPRPPPFPPPHLQTSSFAASTS